MELIVTGGSQAKRKYGFIRIVVNGATDTTEGINVVNRLRKLYIEKAKNAMARYDIDGNRITTEKPNNKGNAALVFAVSFNDVEDFLKEPFFGGLLSAASKQLFHCNFSFNPDDVLKQIDAPSDDIRKEANKLTDDFIQRVFGMLDDPKVQAFLRSYCGNIKIISSDGQGWEKVPYSPRNIAMIYAQCQQKGITPTYFANAREWARCYNRRVKSNESGIVIEMPADNKRLDKQAYSQITGGRDFDQDMSSQGSSRFLAMRLGDNQNDDYQGQYYGIYVYDISQTELMEDDNGKQMDDHFNDPTQQRLVNSLDPSQGFVIQPQQGTQVQDSNGNIVNSPLVSNTDKIPTALENIKNGMKNSSFNGMFTQIESVVDDALNNPTPQSMEHVIKEMARIQLYQIDIKNNQKADYIKIVSDLIMAGCGFGDIKQVAMYARNVQQDRMYKSNIYKKVWDVVRNITKLLNGQISESVMKEQICKDFSYDDILNIFGVEDNSIEQIQEVKNKFNKMLNRLNEVKNYNEKFI